MTEPDASGKDQRADQGGTASEDTSALGAEIAALRARVAELERTLATRDQQVALFEPILENSAAVIFVKDRDGRFILANRRFERVFQMTRAQFLGKTAHDLLPKDIADRVHARDQAALTSKGPVETEEVLPTAEGLRTFISIKFPIFDASGTCIAMCAMGTDITDRKRAEEERAALQQQIIAAQQMSLRELSTPLIPLAEGVLAMPLVGTIDTTRADQIMEALLDGIRAQSARVAILDVTGVKVVDTQVADALIRAAKAAKLLGAEVILTGIGPAVAMSLVQLGTDLGSVMTLGTLQAGIAHAMRR